MHDVVMAGPASRPPRRRRGAMAAAGVGALLVLTACSSGADGPSPSAPAASASSGGEASASASASPASTPSSTLTAAQQQAFDEAVAVVMAYRQTITDLYTGARTDLNDLNEVATGDLLDRGLVNISKGLAEGVRGEPKGAQLILVEASPVTIDLGADPQTVVVRACIDGSGVIDVRPDGSSSPGSREVLDYSVTRTTYLPEPGWAVTQVTGDQDKDSRRC